MAKGVRVDEGMSGTSWRRTPVDKETPAHTEDTVQVSMSIENMRRQSVTRLYETVNGSHAPDPPYMFTPLLQTSYLIRV